MEGPAKKRIRLRERLKDINQEFLEKGIVAHLRMGMFGEAKKKSL